LPPSGGRHEPGPPGLARETAFNLACGMGFSLAPLNAPNPASEPAAQCSVAEGDR